MQNIRRSHTCCVKLSCQEELPSPWLSGMHQLQSGTWSLNMFQAAVLKGFSFELPSEELCSFRFRHHLWLKLLARSYQLRWAQRYHMQRFMICCKILLMFTSLTYLQVKMLEGSRLRCCMLSLFVFLDSFALLTQMHL